jgi:hypothetical protein
LPIRDAGWTARRCSAFNSRSLLCSTSSTPSECAKASSGLSESCP